MANHADIDAWVKSFSAATAIWAPSAIRNTWCTIPSDCNGRSLCLAWVARWKKDRASQFGGGREWERWTYLVTSCNIPNSMSRDVRGAAKSTVRQRHHQSSGITASHSTQTRFSPVTAVLSCACHSPPCLPFARSRFHTSFQYLSVSCDRSGWLLQRKVWQELKGGWPTEMSLLDIKPDHLGRWAGSSTSYFLCCVSFNCKGIGHWMFTDLGIQ